MGRKLMTATSGSTALPPPLTTSAVSYWLKVLGCILAVKGLIFWGDHYPMFFLGDSVSYLNTATGVWIPPDRSFFYGWIIRYLAVRTSSLTTLLAAQTLASALCALICTFILRCYFAVSPRVAAVMGLLCAIEPLQLLYERYVMTEAFSLLTFALFTTIAIGCLKHPSLVRIVLLQMVGVLLVSLRVSFLPVVEAATLMVPVLALARLEGGSGRIPRNWWFFKPGRHFPGWWPGVVAQLFFSCVLFLGLHNGYKRLYAGLIRFELPKAQPAYYYENGFHLLSFVGPLVKPGDFPHPDKAAEIFDDLAFDLGDYRTRDKQRWLQGGLIAHVKAAYPDPLEANRLADETAWNAVQRDPLGELSLALLGFADYWNMERLRAGMITDRGGDRELPPELLLLLTEKFNLSGESLPHISTVTNRYFFSAWVWYLALLLWPLPALFVIGISPAKERPAAILLWVFVTLQIAVIAAFSMSPTVRFLHSTAWLSLITLGVLWSRIQAWRTATHQAPSVGEKAYSQANAMVAGR